MPRNDDYFGYRIFAPNASTARRPAPVDSGQLHSEPRSLHGEATGSPTVATGSKRPRENETNVLVAVVSGGELPNGTTRSTTIDPRALKESIAKLESLLRLYCELHRLSATARSIDVLQRITRLTFYERYYCANRPVILKGLLDGSKALKTWSPQFFLDNFRSVPIQITAGRAGKSDYEMNFRQTIATITMGEFLGRLLQSPETNDFYLVARNYFFDNPAFRSLRDDLEPPSEIIDNTDRSPGSAKLWFGPKGTVTPLHHDEHSILFIQVYGRSTSS